MAELDPLLIASVCFLLTVIALIIARICKLAYDESSARLRTEAVLAMAQQDTQREGNERDPLVIGGRRVANARRRVRVTDNAERMDFVQRMANQNLDNSDDEGQPMPMQPEVDGTIGKKKLAKLQAKEEKKMQREAEMAEREEQKKRDQEREEELKKELKEEEALEAIEKEKKRLGKEEREREEERQYQIMKEAFEVDEEGFDELDDDESANLLRDFEEYIKTTKVVNMDELAARFNLRTEDAIDRLKQLMDDETLTGVIDDRGKFIYITQSELDAVAKFINQRGRVSMNELVEYSNKLIVLQPEQQPASVQ